MANEVNETKEATAEKKKSSIVKKWWFWLIIVVAVLGIAGIGGSDEDETKEIVPSGQATQTADAVSDAQTGSETPEQAEQQTDEQTQLSVAPAADTLTLEETLCFSYNGLTVTATGIEDDSWAGTDVRLLIENNASVDYTVSVEELIVNNCMFTGALYADVAAGKKSNETLDLYSSDLKAAGIENIGQIEIYFSVHESDDYVNTYKPDPVTLYTSQYAEMDTQPDTSGTELYNANGIRIIGRYVDEDSFWGSSILLYLENNSGRNVSIYAEDLSVNGFMIDGWQYKTVYNGKYAFDDITLFASDLQENGITSIDDIELKFRITDADTFDSITETPVIGFSAR